MAYAKCYLDLTKDDVKIVFYEDSFSKIKKSSKGSMQEVLCMLEQSFGSFPSYLCSRNMKVRIKVVGHGKDVYLLLNDLKEFKEKYKRGE